jgi:hypothetical protein
VKRDRKASLVLKANPGCRDFPVRRGRKATEENVDRLLDRAFKVSQVQQVSLGQRVKRDRKASLGLKANLECRDFPVSPDRRGRRASQVHKVSEDRQDQRATPVRKASPNRTILAASPGRRVARVTPAIMVFRFAYSGASGQTPVGPMKS